MKLTYDLHLHSCLSPCGDDDMTPANLVGMAAINGLDLIALTDHNSCKNCEAAIHWGDEYGVLVVPGMEINTIEEVHAVCLFPNLETAMGFDAYVHEHLLPIDNDPDIFGKQEIRNMADEVTGLEPYLLINSTDISFDVLWDLVLSYGGVMFPAHIDKKANSLLANLGFIPPDSQFKTAELHNMKNFHPLKKTNEYLEGCRILCNSDAHYLEHINQPIYTIDVKEKTAAAVVDCLKQSL